MNKFLNQRLLKKVIKFLPNIDIISRYRLANFLTMDILNGGDRLYHCNDYKDEEYIQSKMLLRSYFINQIVCEKGLKILYEELQNFQMKGQKDFLCLFFNTTDLQKKIHSQNRKCLYIMCQDFSQSYVYQKQQILKFFKLCNKIFVVKQENYLFDRDFQAFCIENSIKILKLRQWGISSLTKHLYHTDQKKILINEIIKNDYSIYNQNLKYSPRQVIAFCNFNRQKIQKDKKQFQFEQFMKNYIQRTRFYQYQNNSSNFFIKRFIHKKQAEKTAEIIKQQNNN